MTAQQPVVPPAGTIEGLFLLRDRTGRIEPMQWFECAWFRTGDPEEQWPADLARKGWTYVGPVPEPAVEGGDG